MGRIEEVVFPQFPTHAQISKNKWIKISGNTFYSGTHYIIRNKVFYYMKNYLEQYLPKGLFFKKARIELVIKAPINYGSVRRFKDKGISWNPPAADYHPNWDIDNLAWPWTKSIFDTLIANGVLVDDTVEYIMGNAYSYEECATMDERSITLRIIEV